MARQDDGNDQAVMFVDGDRLIFELIINAAGNQHTASEYTIAPIEPRIYKIILEAVPDDTELQNRIMFGEGGPAATEKRSFYETFNI